MAGSSLPGVSSNSDLTSQTGGSGTSISKVSNAGNLSGSNTGDATVGSGGGGASSAPASPTATVNPNANNPTMSPSATTNPVDSLVNMKTSQAAPDLSPTADLASQLESEGAGLGGSSYNPNGASGTSGSFNSGTLINDAKAWLGTPYEYGGTSRSGVDCSGFTSAVYAQMGVNIGRDTVDQLKSGTMVGQDGNWAADVQQLQPGDLIFYGQPGASGPNAHVVMYIGGGQVIQAGGSNVNITGLFQSASSDEPFLGVRRYDNLFGGSSGSSGGGSSAGAPASISQYVNQLQGAGSTPGEQIFAEAILSGLGDPLNQNSIQGLIDWENAEGGNWHNIDSYNPLNTTQSYDGSHGTNGPGVQAYNSWLDGITATLDTLKNGYYGSILSALASGAAPGALSQAVGSSPWGTGYFST